MLIALLLLQVGSFSAIGTNVCHMSITDGQSMSVCLDSYLTQKVVDKPKLDACGPRWVVEYYVEGSRRSNTYTTTALACYERGYLTPCPTYILVSDRFETKEAAIEFALALDEGASPRVYEIGECIPLEWKTEEVKVKQTTGKWKVK